MSTVQTVSDGEKPAIDAVVQRIGWTASHYKAHGRELSKRVAHLKAEHETLKNSQTHAVSAANNTRFLEDAFRGLTPLLATCNKLCKAAGDGSLPEQLADIVAAAKAADVEYLIDEIPKAIGQSLEGGGKVKKHILFVDDEQPVLDALRRMLHSHRDVWDVTCVNCPEAAWKLLMESPFDVVVSDIKMPGMSGLELLERIQQTKHLKDLPVVMLTGLSTRELKRQALSLGAADLLNKPIEPEDLVARLRSVLRLRSYQDELKAHNELLERRVEERTSDLFHARLDIIWRLGKAAEHRDDATGNHVIRVGCISRAIAETMGLDRDFVATLFLAAPLHDIGKIGIPDSVLLKSGPLSPEEWEVMKQHCQIGARILREDCRAKTAFWQWRRESSPFDAGTRENPVLEMGASIALMHHEKYDGTGYPQALSGDEIPLAARIVAISDAFDAMTSKRPYKEPYPERQALEIIRDWAGTHFAPEVYTAFMHAQLEIRSIRKRFADISDFVPESEEIEDETDLVCR